MDLFNQGNIFWTLNLSLLLGKSHCVDQMDKAYDTNATQSRSYAKQDLIRWATFQKNGQFVDSL